MTKFVDTSLRFYWINPDSRRNTRKLWIIFYYNILASTLRKWLSVVDHESLSVWGDCKTRANYIRFSIYCSGGRLPFKETRSSLSCLQAIIHHWKVIIIMLSYCGPDQHNQHYAIWYICECFVSKKVKMITLSSPCDWVMTNEKIVSSFNFFFLFRCDETLALSIEQRIYK